MNEGISNFNEQLERTRALEEITHYKIWTDRLLEELGRLANGIDSVNEPKDLYVDNKLDFGYEQFSRILNDVYEGAMGTMGSDISDSIRKIDPEIHTQSLYQNIPYELIGKIEKFKKTQNKGDLPNKKDVEDAISRVKGLVSVLSRVDTTK
ncbi:MAG: hypothetical protein WC827_02750 [Candidatus Paceibacterota bacterium]|jgi:hypothetical protein